MKSKTLLTRIFHIIHPKRMPVISMIESICKTSVVSEKNVALFGREKNTVFDVKSKSSTKRIIKNDFMLGIWQ